MIDGYTNDEAANLIRDEITSTREDCKYHAASIKNEYDKLKKAKNDKMNTSNKAFR